MDLHVFNLHKQQWDDAAAPTQFMRDGYSHEVCALALTEALTHSVCNLRHPVVHTYLDTKAAFDSSLKEHVVREVFNAAGKVPSQSILYIANRLSSRKTFLKYNTTVMGPIYDSRGIEQGGISSSRLFQLTTDSTIRSLNESRLGIPIGNNTLAALALADNQVLMANSHQNSQSLIDSAVTLSANYNYQYVPTKTKILVTNPKPLKSSSPPTIPLDSTWSVGGAPVTISSQATHLGIVRSGHPSSNSPAVVTRIAAHACALFGLLNLGLAKGHRTPPATALRIELIFASPVLYSGLAPLLLTKPELSTLNVYSRKILRRILKLHDKTAVPAIHLLSGVLPAEATIHI